MLTANFNFRTKLSEDDGRLSGDSGLQALTGNNETKTKRAIEEINFCLDRPHLLYVYERESGVEINKAIFNALKQGMYNNLSFVSNN